MKKLFALFLALTMVFALASSALAENADLSDHTFVAYQIFSANAMGTGDEAGQLQGLDWGTGITDAGKAALLAKYTNGGVTAVDLANAIKGYTYDDRDARDFAQDVYPYITGTGTAVNGTLPLGYYLIVDKTPGDEVKVYNLSLLYVSDETTEVEVKSKVTVPEITKQVKATGEWGHEDAAGMGNTVQYKFTGTLPSELAEYETYFYKFTDTMSKGLTLTEVGEGGNDITVTIGDVDVTNYFYINATDYSATDGTTITVSIQDIKALDLVEGITVNKDSVVVVTYSAIVNENAVILDAGNPNEVQLEYSNNPDASGTPNTNPPTPPTEEPEPKHPTGETPKKDAVVYVTKLELTKIDGRTNEALVGAEFTLTGDNAKVMKVKGDVFVKDNDGTYYLLKDGTYTTTSPEEEGMDANDYVSTTQKYSKKTNEDVTIEKSGTTEIKAFVGSDGKLTFTGIGPGSYKLEETVVPDGYNKAADITFTVTFNSTAKDNGDTEITFDADNIDDVNNVLSVTVKNNSGAVLPSTGGMGTTLFYIVGSVLVICAGVLLISKKRMDSAE